MDAVIKGNVVLIVRCLSQSGVDVNALSYDAPPLALLFRYYCKADEKTKCEIGQLLIDAGAKVDLTDSFGHTALHYATCSPPTMVVLLKTKPNIAIKNNVGDTPLHVHAAEGNTEQCQLLLAAKADPNATNNAGNTPLMSAVSAGKPQVVTILLAAGADHKIANRSGDTALMVWANTDLCEEDTNECKEIIQERGAPKVCSFSLFVRSILCL